MYSFYFLYYYIIVSVTIADCTQQYTAKHSHMQPYTTNMAIYNHITLDLKASGPPFDQTSP